MNDSEELVRKTVAVPASLAQRVDEIRWAERAKSEQEIYRRLIEAGLAQEKPATGAAKPRAPSKPRAAAKIAEGLKDAIEIASGRKEAARVVEPEKPVDEEAGSPPDWERFMGVAPAEAEERMPYGSMSVPEARRVIARLGAKMGRWSYEPAARKLWIDAYSSLPETEGAVLWREANDVPENERPEMKPAPREPVPRLKSPTTDEMLERERQKREDAQAKEKADSWTAEPDDGPEEPF